MSKFRGRRLAHDNQKRNPTAHHSFKFVGAIADALIMRQRHPSPLPDNLKPFLIGRIVGKMIPMPLNREPGAGKDRGKPLAEVTIREKRERQAARS